MKWDILYLLAGASLGVLIRYAVTSDNLFVESLPVSVLLVNITGCFILGVSSTAVSTFGLDQRYTLLVGIGFCGTLTTMSSFAFETVNLFDAGKMMIAGLDIMLNVGASFFFIILGRAVVLALAGIL
ncbi:MAG: CrcB family protein [Nitrososphaerales archaeon]|jgi:CrcB protein